MGNENKAFPPRDALVEIARWRAALYSSRFTLQELTDNQSKKLLVQDGSLVLAALQFL